MSVKKSALETKTNKELEEYLKEGNRFIPEARLCAFEILKERGIEFSEAETQRIMFLIPQEAKLEEIEVHANYKKAANLIYVSAALGLINVILSPEHVNAFGIIVAIFSLGLLVGIGYVVSTGNEWIKYVLLVLMVVGLLAIPFMLINIVNNPVVGITNIIQTILQIYSLVLLFKISRTN